MVWGLGVVGNITSSWGNQERLYGNKLELRHVESYRYLQVVETVLFVLNSVFCNKLLKPR